MIVPEQMLIEINEPNLIQYAALAEPTFSDFTLEVEAALNEGALASTFGVLFRMQGPAQFYRFAVTGDGMYTLERHDDNGGTVVFTEDWQSSAAIKQGHGSSNILKITARGPKIAIYVNDVLLDEISDNSYLSGNIALSSGTFDNYGTQVSFDNLKVVPPQ
jgi:hypothetical protein